MYIKIILMICAFAWLTIQDIKYSYNVKNGAYDEPIPVTLEETMEDTAKILDEAGHLKTIDAQKLLNLYSDKAMDPDEIRKINSAITDTYVKIKGTADSINKDLVSGWYIIMRQERDVKRFDKWNFLTFYFKNPEEIEKLKNIKIGEKITIVGYCNEIAVGPEMVNCYLR